MRALAAAVLLVSMVSPAFSVSCVSENGKDTDFWVALKGNSGWDYWLGTSDSPTLHNSTYGMGGDHGAIVRTIKQIYGKLPTSHALVVYNDEDDQGKQNADRAHAKGIVLFDGDEGFWLSTRSPGTRTGAQRATVNPRLTSTARPSCV